jgi:hypothetical protein
VQNWKRRKRRRLISDLEVTLEKQEQEADLEKEKADLEATLENEKADLEAEILELKLEHELGSNEIYDLYNQERARSCLDENMEQYQQGVELEFENEKLKDQMAVMAMEGPVAGFGNELSAEETAYQQALNVMF